MDFDLFLMICNYIGTIAFAASGAIKGFGKRLDIFGISLLAIVTAVGGGILRDSIISRFPASLADPRPIYVSILVAVIMYAFVTSKQANASQEKKSYKWLREAYLIFDSIGLIIFSLIGATALAGAGGGIIRDLLINEVPSVLKEDIYALLSFVIGVVYYWLAFVLHFPRITAFIILSIVGFVIRLCIIKFRLSLPNMDKRTLN